MQGTRYIREAAAMLSRPEVPPRERLYGAAQLFWRAMFHEMVWPEPIRDSAQRVTQHLFHKGPIPRTIALMEDADVVVALRELTGFVELFMIHCPLTCEEDPHELTE